jgi:adenosine deaminase
VKFFNSQNIKEAVCNISLTNIAHGIKINDDNLVSYVVNNGIYFDIAPTSNYLTGVIDKSIQHPGVTMINNGIKVTVGSDDPSILNTTLLKEYSVLKSNGVSDDNILKIRENSIDMFNRWSKYSIKNGAGTIDNSANLIANKLSSYIFVFFPYKYTL